MSKHAPGPWSVKREADKGGWRNVCIASKDGLVVANMVMQLDDSDSFNASLISASPDMISVLEELEESASYWSEYDVPLGIVDRIRAAIAKARGKT